MMSVRVEVKVSGELRRNLRTSLDNARVLSPATRILRLGVAQSFRSEGNGRWAKLAERTKSERRREGYSPDGPILRRSGRYRESFRVVLSGNELTVGTSDPRAERLQYGAPADHLPARPVEISQEIIDEAVKAIVAQVLRS